MRVFLQVSWLLGAVAQAQVVDAGARLRALCPPAAAAAHG
jgi:hypothetical protein